MHRLALLLQRFGVGDAGQAGGLDILHERAQLGRLHAELAGQAVITAGPVNNDKITPVAARQHIPDRLDSGAETLPAIATIPQRL